MNQYYHTPYNKAQPILELGSFAEEHPCGIDTGSKGAAGVEFAHRLVVENFGDAVSAWGHAHIGQLRWHPSLETNNGRCMILQL